MIRLSKYPRTVVFVTLLLMFALQRWRFQSQHAKNMALLPFWGFFAVVLLKYGLEGVAERKKIKGTLTNQQKAVYYISVGQVIGGIEALLGLLYFLFFKVSW
jgi:hypothetical protein